MIQLTVLSYSRYTSGTIRYVLHPRLSWPFFNRYGQPIFTAPYFSSISRFVSSSSSGLVATESGASIGPDQSTLSNSDSESADVENSRAAVKRLTADVEKALRKLTINASDWCVSSALAWIFIVINGTNSGKRCSPQGCSETFYLGMGNSFLYQSSQISRKGLCVGHIRLCIYS